MGEPRKCHVSSFGPLLVMHWTPKLGLGPYETKIKRPRAWTFAWNWNPREWSWFL